MVVRKIRKLPSYSSEVRRRLDPKRPKYSAAVRSLAAFARSSVQLGVWLAHLDEACAESIEVWRDGEGRRTR